MSLSVTEGSDNGGYSTRCLASTGWRSQSWRNCRPGSHLLSARKRVCVFTMVSGTGCPGTPFGPVGFGLLKAAGSCARKSLETVVVGSSVDFAVESDSALPFVPPAAGSASSSSMSRSISFESFTAAASAIGAGADASAASSIV